MDMETHLNSFLTPASYGVESSALHPGRFSPPPRERVSGMHFLGGWVGIRKVSEPKLRNKSGASGRRSRSLVSVPTEPSRLLR